MMDITEILKDVKLALGINGDGQDTDLINKIQAVIQLADLPEDIIDTELGKALITVGTTDLWNLAPGEIRFSPAYQILWSKLHNTEVCGGG